MKHNKIHIDAKSDGSELERFYFQFTHPTARAVCIAGAFNDWRPEAEPMYPLGQGYWLKETALMPGRYEYCLVVDGQWMPDPLSKQTAPNPFGGSNSVLHVAGSPKPIHA